MDVTLAGSINQSIVFALDTAGLTISDMKLGYVRWSDGVNGSFTEVLSSALTALALITTDHTDNRAIYLDGDATGANKFILRVDFPDAAFASGKDKVVCNIYDDGNNVVAFRIFSLNPIVSDMVRLDGDLLPDATFNLKKLNILNTSGDAISAISTGSNGRGAYFQGHDSGEAIKLLAGSIADALKILGGAGSGNAVKLEAQGANGSGLNIAGIGAGSGVVVQGGPTGRGFYILGGVTSGVAFLIESRGGNSNAMEFISDGTGKDIDAFEIDILGYPNGYVVYNPGATTNTGTVLGTDGTTIKPVTTMAAAMNLRGQLKTGKILIVGPTGESINGIDMTNTEFRATVPVTLNGVTSPPNVSGSKLHGISFSGMLEDDANTEFHDCVFIGANPEFATFYRCEFATGTRLIQAEGASPIYIDCFSIGTPTFTIDSSTVDIHNWAGPLIVNATALGTVRIYATAETFLTTNSIQAGSTFVLRGEGNFTDNSSSGIPDVSNFQDLPITVPLTDAEKSSLYQGAVWFDDAAANTNSVFGTDGIPTNKVSTPTAALTLLPLVGVGLVKVEGSFTLLADALNVGEFQGADLNSIFDFAGFNAVNNVFRDIVVTGLIGASDDETVFVNCIMKDLTAIGGIARSCIYEGACSIAALLSPKDRFIDYLGSSREPLTLSMAGADRRATFLGWTGDMTVDTLNAVTGDLVVVLAGGKLTLNVSCISGNVEVAGFGEFIDNSAVGCTVDQSKLGLQHWNGSDLIGQDMIDSIDPTSRWSTHMLELAPDTVGGDATAANQTLILSDTNAILPKVNTLPHSVVKNVAINNYEFVLFDTNGDPVTGIAVNASRSLDGTTVVNMVNSVVEVGLGIYKINVAQADTNADTGTWIFGGTGAKTTYVFFLTES